MANESLSYSSRSPLYTKADPLYPALAATTVTSNRLGWDESICHHKQFNIWCTVQPSPHLFLPSTLFVFLLQCVCVCVRAWSGASAVSGATWGNESIWVHALERWRWRKHAGCSVNTQIVTQILAQDACHHIWFWFFVGWGGIFFSFFFLLFYKTRTMKNIFKGRVHCNHMQNTYLLGCSMFNFLFKPGM